MNWTTENLKDQEGKTILITGANTGLGYQTALELAKKNAHVIVAGRSLEKIDQAISNIKSEFPRAKLEAGIVDLSNLESVKTFAESINKKHQKIDVLINNAGISMRATLEELDLNVLRKVMDVNYWGTVYCSKFALPHLLKVKGSVIGVSSIAGFKGLPGRTGYSSSKFAMQGFLESLRIENLKKGLHVLIACPGFTASNIRNTALA